MFHMKYIGLLSVLVFLLAACAPQALAEAPVEANASLVNPAFADPLSEGWRQSSRDHVGYHVVEPLKDGGVRIRKVLCGTTRLEQDVLLETTRMTLSARARFSAQVNQAGYTAHSALVVGYLDAAGNRLGETRYLNPAGFSAPKSDDRTHVVTVKPLDWQDIELDIADELRTHLTGLIPAKVERVRITIETYCSGTSSC